MKLSSTGSSITGAAGTTWKLTIPVNFIPIDSNGVVTNVNSAPNTDNIFESLYSTPNLATTAADAENAMLTASSKAFTEIENARNALKEEVMPILEDSKTDITELISSAETDIVNKLDDYKVNAKNIFKEVDNYESLRFFLFI